MKLVRKKFCIIKKDNFKKYYNIEKDITLQSKVENNHLFVFYNDQWIQLSYKKNPDKFYSHYTLRKRYDSNLCNELGMFNPIKIFKRAIFEIPRIT